MSRKKMPDTISRSNSRKPFMPSWSIFSQELLSNSLGIKCALRLTIRKLATVTEDTTERPRRPVRTKRPAEGSRVGRIDSHC
jgi:hypothetical protein